jgi:hypothetical protein
MYAASVVKSIIPFFIYISRMIFTVNGIISLNSVNQLIFVNGEVLYFLCGTNRILK